MQTLQIAFYEDTYQYSNMTVKTPETKEQLIAGVLEELNHQFNYRLTGETLWASVKDTATNKELFRIARLDKETATVVEVHKDHNSNYKFTVKEPYSLTGILEDKLEH
jgi:hypothetical protein